MTTDRAQRESDLERDYDSAFAEWDAWPDAVLWDQITADGLDE